MCNAFSCIITREKKVIWKFGVDSHDQLLKEAGIEDKTLDPAKISFCKIEISPKNKDYLNPDEWIFKIDMYDMQNKELVPVWWTLDHKTKCLVAHKEWMNELDKILIRKPIINPFDIEPPEKITDDIIDHPLKEWDSVWASVWDSVRAYTGSFFNLPRNAWEYTENIECEGYPFESLVKLYDFGLVPSFDGKKWRLHGGKDAKILWEGEI